MLSNWSERNKDMPRSIRDRHGAIWIYQYGGLYSCGFVLRHIEDISQ